MYGVDRSDVTTSVCVFSCNVWIVRFALLYYGSRFSISKFILEVLHDLYCLHADADRVVARILVGVVDDLGDPIDRVLILIHDLVGVVCPLTVYLNVSSGMFSMVIYWL